MRGLASQLTQAAQQRSPSTRAREAERAHEQWLREHYPDYFVEKGTQRPLPFAFYHDEFWKWVWALKLGVRPKPLVTVWPRGTGKSTGAELAVVAAAARQARKYGLYVSGTQDLADKHVETVGAHLESPRLAEAYPLLAERSIGKYGNSRGWRRNRLRTTAGFYIDAVGLDVAVRGIKVERERPDLIILDDVDEEGDDEAAVDRKVAAITRSILPAGARDLAVLFVQNVIHYESVCARLCGLAPAPEGRRREDFLVDRTVSGPHPALTDFEWQWDDDGKPRIVRGTPTWPEGLGLKQCQAWVNDIGITSFRAEFQHENVASEGSPFAHVAFAHVAPQQVPWDRMERVVCWCDPATSDTDRSDANGVVVAGVAGQAMYVLHAWEKRATPTETLKVALRACRQHGARTLGIETDQGGDTWQSVYYQAVQEMVREGELAPTDWTPAFAWAKAGASQMGKLARWQMMVPDYERAGGGERRIYHVQGPHVALERALLRVPQKKPYDLVDALWHAWNDLMNAATVRFPLAQGIVKGGWGAGTHHGAPAFPTPQKLPSGIYIPRV